MCVFLRRNYTTKCNETQGIKGNCYFLILFNIKICMYFVCILFILNTKSSNYFLYFEVFSIMQVKLDNYEKDIDDNFFNQESITNSKVQIDSFKQSAIKHLKTKRPVTIRIANNDLEAIKIKASKSGVAYQTYINMIIHKEAIKAS